MVWVRRHAHVPPSALGACPSDVGQAPWDSGLAVNFHLVAVVLADVVFLHGPKKKINNQVIHI